MNIEIDGTLIGNNEKPYIVAELSANHNGDIDTALKTIKSAKDCGANAIKIQTYTPDTITIDSRLPDFMIKDGIWGGYNLYELYKEAHTPYEWHEQIFEYAKKIGITCFSTPFDETAVDLLEELNTPAYKIASFEIIDLPLIAYVAKTKKPMIISTGMANLEEIKEAVETAYSNGCKDVILLHCISSYPAPIEQSNLSTIKDLSNRFNVLSGLSDHTLGTTVAITSVAMGACFIEKHFTLNRDNQGPDSEFSIEPEELKFLCSNTKNAWESIGVAGYNRQKSEEKNICFRRSIYIVKDVKAGDILTKENIRRIRPGYGLPPKYYDELLGKRVKQDFKRGVAVTWDMVYD